MLGIIGEQVASDPTPGLDRLEELLDHLRAAGLTVELTVEGDARPLDPGLGVSAYRIIQEALTNVARHAGASSATLQLTLQRRDDGDALQWQVSDDGAGLGSLQVALQRGNGLAGIRQRVWALGSDLECNPVGGAVPRGLCLRARFRMPAIQAMAAIDGLRAA
jgi:two-component system sensor histidine kinase UhpB